MVKWSDHAKADLRHIHDFIAENSRHYAKKVVQEIVDKTLRLSELPRIGKVVPEIDNEHIRTAPVFLPHPVRGQRRSQFHSRRTAQTTGFSVRGFTLNQVQLTKQIE